MPYNVSKQIQEAMERGDFNNLPGKGKPQQRDDNPYIPPAVRTVNQMLKDNGFAPRWIEVDKEIRVETENAEKLIENLKGRRSRLEVAAPSTTTKTRCRFDRLLNWNAHEHWKRTPFNYNNSIRKSSSGIS